MIMRRRSWGPSTGTVHPVLETPKADTVSINRKLMVGFLIAKLDQMVQQALAGLERDDCELFASSEYSATRPCNQGWRLQVFFECDRCPPPTTSIALMPFRWTVCTKCVREVTRDRVLRDRRNILLTYRCEGGRALSWQGQMMANGFMMLWMCCVLFPRGGDSICEMRMDLTCSHRCAYSNLYTEYVWSWQDLRSSIEDCIWGVAQALLCL